MTCPIRKCRLTPKLLELFLTSAVLLIVKTAGEEPNLPQIKCTFRPFEEGGNALGYYDEKREGVMELWKHYLNLHHLEEPDSLLPYLDNVYYTTCNFENFIIFLCHLREQNPTASVFNLICV